MDRAVPSSRLRLFRLICAGSPVGIVEAERDAFRKRQKASLSATTAYTRSCYCEAGYSHHIQAILAVKRAHAKPDGRKMVSAPRIARACWHRNRVSQRLDVTSRQSRPARDIVSFGHRQMVTTF
jgi:hypothetical protein